MEEATLLPHSPVPTPPPYAPLSPPLRRWPCDGCSTEVVQTWIPVNITTASCDTTNTNAWWTQSPSPWMETEVQSATATITAMATVPEQTVTATVIETSRVIVSATCCVRSGRWPVSRSPHQNSWIVHRPSQVLVGAQSDAFQGAPTGRKRPFLDSDRDGNDDDEHHGDSPTAVSFKADDLRFEVGNRMSHGADLLFKRWWDGPAQVVTVTAVETATSTSVQWAAATSIAVVPIRTNSGAGYGQETCQSPHQCGPDGTGPASALDQVCGCVVAWVTVVYGAVPKRSSDLAAAVIFFFAFLLFFLVAMLRTSASRRNVAILVNLIPVTVFSGGMATYFAMRAWSSNNAVDKGHIIALHAMLLCLPLFLVDAMLQLVGLLSKRATKGGWIRRASHLLRFVNAVTLTLDIIAAYMFHNFLSAWIARGDSCDTSSSRDLSLVPLVADWLIALCLISIVVLTIAIRLRHFLPAPNLAHVLLIVLFLLLHFLWRILRDWNAQSVWYGGWEQWQPSSPPTGSNQAFDPTEQCWGVLDSGSPDWTTLSEVRTVGESPYLFYLLGTLPLLTALVLLLMVNLPAYLLAQPVPLPPRPDPDAMYQMTYDARTQHMKLSPVDAKVGSTPTQGGVKADGKPYYRLVRSSGGQWKVKRIASPGPGAGSAQEIKGFLFGWQ
ncbi:hypothetical protein ACQY0O_004483 [Thecaphora frezii]